MMGLKTMQSPDKKLGIVYGKCPTIKRAVSGIYVKEL